jgi:GNAT superfamily N-acetyltransferase
MIVREARPEDARGIARVRVDTWRTTYRGLIPDNYLNQLSYDEKELSYRDKIADKNNNEYFFIAEEDNAVVGFAICGPERSGYRLYGGEIYAIYVLEAYQRKGIGRALVKTSIGRLRELGFCSMLLWVLDGNLYCHFYERLGGAPIARKKHEMNGAELELVAYGWPDISGL